MSELKKERLLELLADDAIFGLSEKELAELRNLQSEFPEVGVDESFMMAATSIDLANLDVSEQMPQSSQARILLDADKFFDSKDAEKPIDVDVQREANKRSSETEKQGSSISQWLGWAVAGVACVALIGNIWFTQFAGQRIAGGTDPVKTPTPEKSEKEQFNELLADSGVVRAKWSPVQKDVKVSGEIVWSDSEQKGFMKFEGLPINDKTKETYQLWIFDENQDEKTPVDGGVFDVDADGELLVAIDAKIKVKGPKVFAVTVEKPGGVVVSKQEKVVALGKV